MDRDLVHRQTATNVVKHMALGVAGLGREDAMLHLLNYVWVRPRLESAFVNVFKFVECTEEQLCSAHVPPLLYSRTCSRPRHT